MHDKITSPSNYSIGKIGKVTHWFKRRSPQYIFLRLGALLQRYGISSERAKKRTFDCVRFLARYGCFPSFPTPGSVVKAHPDFCRALQAMGAELSIHSYDHIDFHSLSSEESTRQLTKAIQAYQQRGIDYQGFRCPYLSYSDKVLHALPKDMLKYSSNRAIWWDVVPSCADDNVTAIFDSLKNFYNAQSSATAISVPYITNSVVEIPVSLPDDLQLYDGLKLGEQGLAKAWVELLHRTHRRGEMFILLFHPESFYQCAPAFGRILQEAQHLQPRVWITRLRDISDWWCEKSHFTVDTSETSSELTIHFTCTDRATILVRHLACQEPIQHWHGSYALLDSHSCHVAATPRPFVGVVPGVPEKTISFLSNQGYIVDTSLSARDCGICLDSELVTRFSDQTQLIGYIETRDTPLIRYWRWPNAYQSALSITGDLDALSLLDYGARLFPW